MTEHEIDSHYSIDFDSFELNEIKYDCFEMKAQFSKEFRNYISKLMFGNINHTLYLSTFDAVKHYKTNWFGLVQQDTQKIIEDVHNSYVNKFDAILDTHLHFKVQDKIKVEFYKKTTTNKKGQTFQKGDVKSVRITLKNTKVTYYLDYMLKFKTLTECFDYILKNHSKANKEQQLFYDSIINFVSKVGETRIETLLQGKKQRLINKYNNKPNDFKSLNYRSLSRLTVDFVGENKNNKSEVEYFLNIGGCYLGKKVDKNGETVADIGKVVVPIKWNKKYHGSPELYNKPNVSYTLIPLKNKQIRVVLTHEGTRNVYTDGDKAIGVDVNIKHNMLSLEDEKVYDYDRKLLNKFCNLLKKVDKAKEQKIKLGFPVELANKTSKKNQKDIDSYTNKLEHNIEMVCSEFVKNAKLLGFNHVVMEDLTLSSKMYSSSEEFEGMNYARLFRLCNLASINDIVKGICYKNEMTFSLVHPHYTSKQCSKCGCIHDDNRKNQEVFSCVKCGYTVGADFNSPANIKKRVTLDVLSVLLNKTKLGELRPRKLGKEFIKQTLGKLETNSVVPF